jgi:replicative DNA helicase
VSRDFVGRDADRAHRVEHRVEQLRIPPQSVEAEQAVLGALMLAPESLNEVADLLTHEDFYRRDHQLIWKAIVELAEKGKPYDAVTLGEWFDAQGLGEQVAGGAYLVELASTTPSAANIRAYAEIVADKALLRAGIEVGTEFVNSCFQPDGRESQEIIANSAGQLAQLTARGPQATTGLRPVRGQLAGAWADLERRYSGGVNGLVLPWPNVARLVPALEPTDFMLIAGRPSMGKTILGMEVADEAAASGRNVAVFSLEMSTDQLITRMLSRRARVPMDRMRAAQGLQDEDWSRLAEATRAMRDLPLAIDDSAGATIGALSARAQRMHAKVPGGLGLVVVDYLQLIEGEGRRDEKRNDEITKISRGLKLLAKRLRCPVIALSQLNRGLETRTDKRPVMSDLRESGALEQDADVIAFVYRDDYYTKEASGAPGVAEVIIGKNRNGPTGTAYLTHDLPCSRFEHYQGRPSYAPKGEASAKARPARRGYAGPAERELPEDASP